MNILDKKEFKAVWKLIANDKRIKPTFEDKEMHGYDYSQRKSYTYMQKFKTKGFVYPEHHIIFNVIIGRPIDCGFVPDSAGFKDAVSFFKGNYSTYKSNLIFSAFKDFVSAEEYSKLIEEIKLKLK